MKVALVHDWLIHMRGGEKVLESFAEIFPDATIYTLFSYPPKLSPSLQRMKIRNSFLHHLPGIRNYYPWFLPILPWVIKTLHIEDAEVVISSSHCVAKGAKIPKGAVHICYCHTPMRYLWGFEKDYFGKFPNWLRKLLDPILAGLRKWDVESSKQVNEFLCNSENVRSRIRNVYGRDAVVIPPPVESNFFKAHAITQKKDYYLVVSALTPYKRVDLVIEAFNHWNRQVLIAGEGPSQAQLGRLAKSPNIRFLGKVSDDSLRELYSEASALIFPQDEDFGIVPLEAQACGTPIIAFGRGGALETVKDGVFFYEQTPEALRQAVTSFEKKHFDPETLRQHAVTFDKEAFKNKIRQTLGYVIR